MYGKNKTAPMRQHRSGNERGKNHGKTITSRLIINDNRSTVKAQRRRICWRII